MYGGLLFSAFSTVPPVLIWRLINVEWIDIYTDFYCPILPYNLKNFDKVLNVISIMLY